MTTMPASTTAPARDTAQERVSRNIVQMLSLRGQSKARLARHLDLDPAGISRRVLGGTRWNLEEVEQAAAFVAVPWEWLYLPLPELMAKVTQGGGPDLGTATGGYLRGLGVTRGFRGERTAVTRPRHDLVAA